MLVNGDGQNDIREVGETMTLSYVLSYVTRWTDAQIVVRSGKSEVEKPLLPPDDGSYGFMQVFDSEEALQKAYPGAKYFAIETIKPAEKEAAGT